MQSVFVCGMLMMNTWLMNEVKRDECEYGLMNEVET